MAIKDFFRGFPEYADNDFYIIGEGYAGIYIPTLTDRILQDPEINFQVIYSESNTQHNKRSKDLGALLDSCSWDDIGNFFLLTCIKNSLLQTKSIEMWVNSHTVPHYACINFRSYSTP